MILDKPTKAREVPWKSVLAHKKLLGYEPFTNEGKLTYIKLNIQTPIGSGL